MGSYIHIPFAALLGILITLILVYGINRVKLIELQHKERRENAQRIQLPRRNVRLRQRARAVGEKRKHNAINYLSGIRKFVKPVEHISYLIAFVAAAAVLTEYVGLKVEFESNKLAREVRSSIADLASEIILLRNYCITNNAQISLNSKPVVESESASIANACAEVLTTCQIVEEWIFTPYKSDKRTFGQFMSDLSVNSNSFTCDRIDQSVLIYKSNFVVDIALQQDRNSHRWRNVRNAINRSIHVLREHQKENCVSLVLIGENIDTNNEIDKDSGLSILQESLRKSNNLLGCSSISSDQLPRIKSNLDSQFQTDSALYKIYTNNEISNHWMVGVLQNFHNIILFYVITILIALKIVIVQTEL